MSEPAQVLLTLAAILLLVCALVWLVSAWIGLVVLAGILLALGLFGLATIAMSEEHEP